MTTSRTRSSSDLPISPGEILDEELKARDMSPEELAIALALPVATVNEILQAEKPITPEIANSLESALGIGSDFWTNLETDYRATLDRISGKGS